MLTPVCSLRASSGDQSLESGCDGQPFGLGAFLVAPVRGFDLGSPAHLPRLPSAGFACYCASFAWLGQLLCSSGVSSGVPVLASGAPTHCAGEHGRGYFG